MVSSRLSPLCGYAQPQKTEETPMAKRINLAIELLEADQAIYYVPEIPTPTKRHTSAFPRLRCRMRIPAELMCSAVSLCQAAAA